MWQKREVMQEGKYAMKKRIICTFIQVHINQKYTFWCVYTLTWLQTSHLIAVPGLERLPLLTLPPPQFTDTTTTTRHNPTKYTPAYTRASATTLLQLPHTADHSGTTLTTCSCTIFHQRCPQNPPTSILLETQASPASVLQNTPFAPQSLSSGQLPPSPQPHVPLSTILYCMLALKYLALCPPTVASMLLVQLQVNPTILLKIFCNSEALE